jgi:hypothetical protein
MGAGVVEPPGRSATELAVLAVVVYPLIFVVGLYTINHSIAALVLGAVVACGWTLALALAALQIDGGLMRLDVMSSAHESPFYRYQVVSLFLTMSAVGAILHLLAIGVIARRAFVRRAVESHLSRSWASSRERH